MNIYLELFGYLGTFLVIASMIMTSINKLRILNITGSIISLIYSVIINAYPIVLLNAALILINTFQLIRYYLKHKTLKNIQIEDK